MSALILVPSELERTGLALPPGLRVTCCGVGPVHAALGTARLLRDRGVQCCLLAGLGGTRNPERVPVGQLVLGSAVRNEAVGAGFGEGFLPLGEMDLGTADDLLELAAPTGMPGQRCVLGTVAAASASWEQAEARWRRHPDVAVEEMEAWGVALACAQAGVPLTVLRAVSNLAGQRDRATWELDGAFALLREALRNHLS